MESKLLKNASQKVKEFANMMIKNGNEFTCMICDLTLPDGSYLDNDIIKKWLENLYINELKYKELPAKALENMRKKGIEPKKQPIENILIVITSNIDSIYVGISVPDKYKHFEDIFFKDLPVYYGITENAVISIFNSESPLKERDNVLQNMFNNIKKCGLYLEEDEDEEIINYLDQEI